MPPSEVYEFQLPVSLSALGFVNIFNFNPFW